MAGNTFGRYMRQESGQAMDVFCKAAKQTVTVSKAPQAIYTVARGSSDAAANILSYEFMRELGVPMTSLPPSVFSLGNGVALGSSAVMVISQSGASDDLVRTAKGARDQGVAVMAITNQPNSAVEAQANVTVPIGAGKEMAIPATKTVTGSIGAGMAVLSALKPDYAARAKASVEHIAKVDVMHPKADQLQAGLLRARHVYVIGRDTGYGAAHETALKLKECCAIHAEAYSSSEVLHGPLQLATNPLTVLILDNGLNEAQGSLDRAQKRFEDIGCDVFRIAPSDIGLSDLVPAASAAVLLAMVYPIIMRAAIALGLDPDAPGTLSKVTQTT